MLEVAAPAGLHVYGAWHTMLRGSQQLLVLVTVG